MIAQEKMLYMSSRLMMLSIDKEHNQKEIEEISEELAALQRQLRESANFALMNEDESDILKFTEKEILKMPKTFRQKLRQQGCVICVRKRTSGRYKCSYEIRYARRPYSKHPISASGPTIEIAKLRFIEKLKSRDATAENTIVPINFDKFVTFWFENFHACKVSKKTYKNNLSLYNRHIKKVFGQMMLDSITPTQLKNYLNELPGNGKTADDVYSILNQVFDIAVSLKKIAINPLNYFVHTPHERENGVELIQNEEIRLLGASKGTVYELIYAVILFCGLRPNEYKTARIEGDFIIAQNSKRKNGKIEYKKIPICSALRAILNDCRELPKRHEASIRDHFKKIFPNHTLKDLRKTFSTRCINLHIDTYARKKFMGHSVDKLDKPYIGRIDEYLLTEGKKLDAWNVLTFESVHKENGTSD